MDERKTDRRVGSERKASRFAPEEKGVDERRMLPQDPEGMGNVEAINRELEEEGLKPEDGKNAGDSRDTGDQGESRDRDETGGNEEKESGYTPAWKLVLITVLSIFLLIALLLGGGYFYINYNLSPPAARGTSPIAVTIPKGASSGEISQILYSKGLIRNAALFRYYIRYKGVGGDLKAGEYRFTPGMTVDELLDKMVKGEVYRETFSVTIPEGLTVPQIADLLSSEGVVNKERFLKEVNEGSFSYPFLKEIPPENLKQRKYRLEGYLFPETYTFNKGATEHEIIDRMLGQFQKVFTEEWKQELAKKGLNIDQGVILASIVEREAVLDEERPLIAGVFYNRLEERWKLQSCATVQFILGKQKDRITYKDLEIEDPYNTYLHVGLPPGPIGNPGKKSLEATVYPAKHDYFFFVTKNDGSQGHFFSKTFEEHKKNHAKSEGSW
ncbi:MAG: endolytic transglycosylase MltG [Thermicanus sp.]|nr:endolytic transglycosylase MltG [Thermicanus sp.]